MSGVKFSDIKSQLEKALQEKLSLSLDLNFEKGFALIDGFMMLSVHGEISNSLIVGGPNIPTIAIVGNTTGRIYTFALKAILPDIKI